MDSKRQHKYARQIQKILSEIFQRDTRHYFGNALVSITGVEVAVDLSLAKVFFSVFPSEGADEVIAQLDGKKSEVRRHLGNEIGKRARKVPELAFFNDDTEEKANHIDRLIDSLDIPPPSDEDMDQ